MPFLPQRSTPDPSLTKNISKVAGFGDINGDEVDDIAFVATPPGKASHVVIIYGGVLDYWNVIAFDDLDHDGLLGIAIDDLDGIGDVNDDGLADAAIGLGAVDSVYILRGSSSSLDYFSLSHPLRGTKSFGAAVSGAGDINNDGFDDLLIGAPDWAQSGPFNGAVYAYYGGNKFGSDYIISEQVPAWNVLGENSYGHFGMDVAITGIDGNGKREVAYYQRVASTCLKFKTQPFPLTLTTMAINSPINSKSHSAWTVMIPMTVARIAIRMAYQM